MARRIGRCSTMPALCRQESRYGLPDDLACRDATLARLSTEAAREALRHLCVMVTEFSTAPTAQARPLAPVRGSDRLAAAISQRRATTPWPPPPCRSRPRANAAPLSVVRPFALASNESSDIGVLPFASQINHAPPSPARNRPLEAEVIFCVQGAISPLLANIYLHYALDLWAVRWRRRESRSA
jgi:hypothetical protein